MGKKWQTQYAIRNTFMLKGEVILDITQEAEEAEEGCHAEEAQLAEGIIEMIEMEVKLAKEELVDTGMFNHYEGIRGMRLGL